MKNKIFAYSLVFFTVLAFLGVTFLVIIISRGGLITKEGIVETGVIRLIVTPKDADFKVYLDNEQIKLQDKRINRLTEGTYSIVIESDGFASWEKEVKVSTGIVTEIEAKLYPNNYSLEQITQTNIDNVFYSSTGEYVYYVITKSNNKTDRGIWRYKLAKNQFFFNKDSEPEKITGLLPEIEDIIVSGDYLISPSLDNKRILLQDDQTMSNLVFNAESLNQEIEINLNEKLGFTPEEVAWLNDSKTLFIKDGKILLEYNIDSSVSSVIKYSQDNGLVYSVANSTVVFFDKDTLSLYRYETGKSSEEILLEKIKPSKTISDIYSAKGEDGQIFIYKDLDGYTFFDIEDDFQRRIIGPEYNFMSISNDGKSALFNDGKDVYSFNIKEILATKNFETKFKKTTFSYNEDDILQFIPQSSHIINYNNKEQILSIAEKDGTNKFDLLKEINLSKPTFKMNDSGESLFILLEDESAANSFNIYKINFIQ